MARRVVVVAVIVSLALAVTAAFASTLTNNSNNVASGSQHVLACGSPSGWTYVFNQTGTGKTVLSSVTVSSVDALCGTQAAVMTLTVAGSTGTTLGSGSLTINGTNCTLAATDSCTVTLSPSSISAISVKNYSVSVVRP